LERIISLPDDLLAQIEESIRAQMEKRAWRNLLEYGHQTGQASGYSVNDVPGIVRKRRRKVSGRC
jgi:hypothetical protein